MSGGNNNNNRVMPLDYIRESLGPNEKIVHVGRFHWFYDVVSWFWLVIGLLLAVAVIVGGAMYVIHVDMARAFPDIDPSVEAAARARIINHYGGWIGLVRDLHWAIKAGAALCAFWGMYVFLVRMIVKYSTEIAVTSQRLVFKRGVVARYVGEMKLDKIEGINVWQSFFGRIFNYGRLSIHGIGVGKVGLPELEDPIKFRKAIDFARSKMGEGAQERSGFDPLQNPVDN